MSWSKEFPYEIGDNVWIAWQEEPGLITDVDIIEATVYYLEYFRNKDEEGNIVEALTYGVTFGDSITLSLPADEIYATKDDLRDALGFTCDMMAGPM